jgi:hypothetical protein
MSPGRVYEKQGDFDKGHEYYFNEWDRLLKEFVKYYKNIIHPSDVFYIKPDSNSGIDTFGK